MGSAIGPEVGRFLRRHVSLSSGFVFGIFAVALGAITASYNFVETARAEIASVAALAARNDFLLTGQLSSAVDGQSDFDAGTFISYVDQLRDRIPTVSAVSPVLVVPGTIDVGDGPRPIDIVAVGSEFARAFGIRILDGAFLSPRDVALESNVVLLGATLAEGSQATRSLGDNTAVLNGERVHVIGVYGADMRPPFYQLNSSVIVPFSDRAFTEFSRVDWALYVSVSDLNMSKDTFVRHVSSTLDPEIIRIWSSREVGGRAEDLLAMLTIMSSGANAIMLLIAVAATATLVSFDVIRRFREIAIRRAVGASRRQIVQAILIRVSVLALLALPAGALLGYILSIYLVAPLGQLIVSGSWTFNLLSPSLLNAVAVMVIGVLLAAGYPAYLAAHVDPTALLRRGQD